jgi:hypothetical protein
MPKAKNDKMRTPDITPSRYRRAPARAKFCAQKFANIETFARGSS